MKALSTVRALSGVRRVWPGRDDSIIFELAIPAGKLHAGRADREGEAQIAGYASNPELPEPTPGVAGRLVVHRFHRQAVVLIDDRTIKFTHQGRTDAVVVQSSQAMKLCDGSGTTVARVPTHSPSRVKLALLPGRTLHDLGSDVLPGWWRFIEA